MKNLVIKNTKILAAALVFTLGACAVKPQTAPPAVAGQLVTDGKLWASVWQQRADEYKALCFQAYNVARWRLDQQLTQSHTKPLAIVTDVDETVLDNSPYAVQQSLAGKDYEPLTWMEWTNKGICDTVPGAAAFLKYAASKGVTVFYITNREEKERAGTLKNLRLYNLPNADNAHLFLKTTTSGKETRRQEVLKTHQIALLIGDNLSDLSALFDKRPMAERLQVTRQQAANFGDRFIVLPNASYGDWESALYQYNYNLPPARKAEVLKNAVIDGSKK